MKTLIIGFFLFLTIGCQNSDSQQSPEPIPTKNCEAYATELLKYSGLAQPTVLQMMIMNSERINILGLIECLDQELEIKCQNNLCHMRKK